MYNLRLVADRLRLTQIIFRKTATFRLIRNKDPDTVAQNFVLH